MSEQQKDGQRVAADFLALNPDEFRMFWACVQMEWNQEDWDIEAQWFYNGGHMRERDFTVIHAMLGALESGQKSASK